MIRTLFLACVVQLCIWTVAYAGVSFEIVPGVGYLTGYSTYQIGNIPMEDDYVTPPRAPYFPISELKFPLMSGIATIDANLTMDKIVISGSARKNITSDSGHMRDYDWGMPYFDENGPDGAGWYVHSYYSGSNVWYDLDIESKSDTKLDANMWEAGIAYRIFSMPYDYSSKDPLTKDTKRYKGELVGYLGIGYEKRHYDFECELNRQWSPSGHDAEYYAAGDGSVTITYYAIYSLPFIELSLVNHSEKFDFGMDFGFSPLVSVHDEDVHLARIPGPIYNEGRCTGNAFKYAARVSYNISPKWFVSGVVDFLHVRANGTQHQTIYEGSHTGTDADGDPYFTSWNTMYYTIDERILSQQSMFSFKIGYRLTM